MTYFRPGRRTTGPGRLEARRPGGIPNGAPQPGLPTNGNRDPMGGPEMDEGMEGGGQQPFVAPPPAEPVS